MIVISPRIGYAGLTSCSIWLMNGLSTYLLADICFVNVDVNMDTPGQRPVVDDLPDVARSYAPRRCGRLRGGHQGPT